MRYGSSLHHINKYLNISFLVLLLLKSLFSSMALAVTANPSPFIEQQPDGTEITLQMKGDEYFHWLQDLAGYTVVREKDWYVYAELDNQGQLIPTQHVVGQVDPADVNLRPGNLPPEDKRIPSSLDGPSLAPGLNVPQAVPPFGIVKNLVVMIRFSNHQSRLLPSTEDMDILFNAQGGHPTLAPTGSIRDYFLENSYGQMNLVSDISGWIDVSNTEQYYANGVSGLSGGKVWEALREALDKLDQTLDFSQYDSDGDGFIDAITFIHSGYGAENPGSDADGTVRENRIWSHKWTIQPAWTSGEGVKVSNYHINPGLWGITGSEIGRIGTIAHETGHFFGLPDLYDTDNNGKGIGSYGLMANSWGFDGTQHCPPHLSAWSKIRLGWLNPTIISEYGQYTLRELEFNADVYRIDQGFSSGEYLLIENRQNSGFDCSMPQGGLTIWHIDENAEYNTQGYPGQTNWPENSNHYRVALLQADGFYNLEKNVNRGDAGDVFHSGGIDSIGSGTDIYPNTDTYQFGIIAQTGISIHSISASGPFMTFCLGDAACAGISTHVLPDNQWHQISLPANPEQNNTVDAVFGDDGLGTYGTDWTIFRYDTDGDAYVELTITDTLSLGLGYWIIQATGSDKTLVMPVGSTPTPTINSTGCPNGSCFEIPLGTEAGTNQWNMIGYPFSVAGLLGDSRVIATTSACGSGCTIDDAETDNILHNQVWSYNGTEYILSDTVSGTLDPWLGYWVVMLNDANENNPSLLIPKP